jgi:hypothetical protein
MREACLRFARTPSLSGPAKSLSTTPYAEYESSVRSICASSNRSSSFWYGRAFWVSETEVPLYTGATVNIQSAQLAQVHKTSTSFPVHERGIRLRIAGLAAQSVNEDEKSYRGFGEHSIS